LLDQPIIAEAFTSKDPGQPRQPAGRSTEAHDLPRQDGVSACPARK